MANAQKVKLGDQVRYRKANGSWTVAKVVALTSQTAVKLSTRKSDGTFVALNGGADVNRAAVNIHQLATTNVWKVY